MADQKTIGSDVGRDYPSPDAWATYVEGQSPIGDAYEGEVYNDASANQDTFENFQFTGVAGSSAANYVMLYAHDGNGANGYPSRHDGREGYGVRIDGNAYRDIWNAVPYFYCYDMYFYHTGGGSSRYVMDDDAGAGTTGIKYVNCMFHLNASSAGGVFFSRSGGCLLVNCVFFADGSTDGFGVNFGDADSDNFVMLNCVVHNAWHDGIQVISGVTGGTILNTIATNNGRDGSGLDFDPAVAVTADYIISSDTSHNDANFGAPAHDKQVSNANFESAITDTSPWNFQWQNVAAFTTNFQNYGDDQSVSYGDQTPSIEDNTRDFAGGVCDCGPSEYVTESSSSSSESTSASVSLSASSSSSESVSSSSSESVSASSSSSESTSVSESVSISSSSSESVSLSSSSSESISASPSSSESISVSDSVSVSSSSSESVSESVSVSSSSSESLSVSSSSSGSASISSSSSESVSASASASSSSSESVSVSASVSSSSSESVSASVSASSSSSESVSLSSSSSESVSSQSVSTSLSSSSSYSVTLKIFDYDSEVTISLDKESDVTILLNEESTVTTLLDKESEN